MVQIVHEFEYNPLHPVQIEVVESVVELFLRGLMEHYYHREDLAKFGDIGKASPELWQKFSAWYSAVFSEGALTEREKALIALAVAHSVQCPYCIDAYSQACLEKGSNLEQMTEAVHVASAIRGGASLVHAVQMRNIVERIEMA